MLEELRTIFVSCGFQASLFVFSDFADYLLFVAPYEGKNGHNRQIILGTSLKDFYESNVDFFEGLLYTRVCLSPSGKQMR